MTRQRNRDNPFKPVIWLLGFVMLAAISPANAGHGKTVSLDRLVRAKGLNPARTALLVLDVSQPNDGSPFPVVYAHNAEKMLIPASLLKLFTTWTAFSILKPEFTFHTRIYSDAPPANGTVSGNLYVESGGDPFLVQENLMLLAKRIRESGVKKIRGNLVLDNSGDREQRPPGWKPKNYFRAYAAPLSPLAYSYNAVTITVQGESPGTKPRVKISPDSSYLHVRNTAKTVKGAGKRIGIDLLPGHDGETVAVSGRIAPGKTVTAARSIHRPMPWFARSLIDEMHCRGIDFSNEIRTGEIPKDSYLLVDHPSPPLGYLVSLTNQYSNNFMAEMILKAVGAAHANGTGSRQAGIAAVSATLKSMRLDPAELHQVDGSGLSRENRTTAKLLGNLLAHIVNDFRMGPEFLASLSSSGATGTFKKRLKNPEDYRLMRGKSGLLNHVNNLAGIIRTRSGKRLVFVLMMNDYTGSFDRIRSLENRICQRIRSL